MVMRLALIPAITAMLAGGGSRSENSDPCKVVPAQRVRIDDLRAAPVRYEKVRLSIAGVLESGHLGVLLKSPTGGAIRIRSVTELSIKRRACNDGLNSRLWDLADESDLPAMDRVQYVVVLEGFLRVLKDKRGKPATEFNIFGQWPLEICQTPRAALLKGLR